MGSSTNAIGNKQDGFLCKLTNSFPSCLLFVDNLQQSLLGMKHGNYNFIIWEMQ
jgi:hypothetical protein